MKAGTPITSIRRDAAGWIVNDAIRTPMLVGAGGHFCPVARSINGPVNGAPLVVAQEAEFPIDEMAEDAFAVEGEVPELYFCRDLKGYGWCVRKGAYLNIGLGRLDRQSLPGRHGRFVAFLKPGGRFPRAASWRWRGHAYASYDSARRRVVDDGVLLAGDAAGLAYPQSGEGIRPAIESGLLAAATIIEANGRYSRSRLEPYEPRLQARFGSGPLARCCRRCCRSVSRPDSPRDCSRRPPSCDMSCSIGGSCTARSRRSRFTKRPAPAQVRIAEASSARCAEPCNAAQSWLLSGNVLF